MTLRVAPNCSILGKDRKVHLAGTKITDKCMTKGQVQEHINSGFLIDEDAPKAAHSSLPPGVTQPLARDADGKAASPWAMDPDGLRGMDVHQLNVMVQERDPDEEEFDNANDAILFLSQDYEPPVLESEEDDEDE